MSGSSSGFESESSVSPRLVIIAVAILVLAVQPVSESLLAPSLRVQMRSYTLLLFGLLAMAWLLERWKPWVAKWFIIVLLVAIVPLANSWQGVPGTLALMAIPTGLAAALITLPAAVATAVGETVLLLLLPRTAAAGGDRAAVGVALVAIWATLGVMYAVYRPVRHIARWSWGYYERAQGLLEEARDRRAELEQALDDLAHANRQLALAGDRLAALRLIAEEAEKAKAAFVAKVSHEFRTPLNMIIGLVGLMVESPEVYGRRIPPAVSEDLMIVRRNCEHLASMVNDVLALSQAEAGRLALHRERVDLAEVIDGALAVVRPLVEKKELSLGVSIPDILPQVYCDRTRIRQVILNLASNAARFTEQGGISIRVAERDQHVVVSVTDTGPGILPEDAERIFEPFCQGTSDLWHDKGGSGLGLSVSKQFVELHGGRIWLESEPEAGTTFSFELPISPPMAHVARPGHRIREDWVWVERASRAGLSSSLSKPRIVICDETGDLYPVFARYTDEIEFVDTRDLAQVTQELRECPAQAVVLNTVSPDNLWRLAERARLETPDTPVIGCSVLPQVERALEAGAAGYLIKPVTRTDLQEVMQAAGKPVRRVLVVDDDPDVLRLFTRMLRACDETLEVATALSGKQALDELRSSLPDLMLLDIVMPVMDGWQVLEIKERDGTIRDIPVILVSAQDPRERPLASQALLATMDDGLSLSKLVRCSLEISALLLQPD
jgi:signal transduction histidine kinase/CheY-like chemotaxis protein